MSNIIIAEPWSLSNPNINNPVINSGHEYLKFLNTNVFNEDARRFLRYGYYCNAPVGTKDYDDFWNEQEMRCLYGYEVGGVRITGRHYFMLNFGLMKARAIDPVTGKESKSDRKIITFPRFLDHQYYLFHEVEECFAEGKYEDQSLQGLIVAKGRRKGVTYVNAAGILVYNYNFIEGSNNILCAYEKSHYKVTIDAVWLTINHLNKNTDFAKRRLINQHEYLKSGFTYQNDFGQEVEDGYLSEIRAMSFKDNEFRSIGESCTVACWEESGKFSNLIGSYTFTEPTWKDGDIMTGSPVVWGCVCAGTKIWTYNGREVSIENLNKEDGVIGYGGIGALQQPIIWQKPVAIKPCYRIETSNGMYIECSNDHPLLWSRNHYVYQYNGTIRKKVTFKKAEDIRVGDQLMCNRQIPIFGDKRMWIPRLVGLLIGDGNYSINATHQLSVSDDDVYNYIQSINVKEKIYKQFKQKDGKEFRDVGISGIREELRKLGILCQTKENKHLPDCIYKFDMYSICELLGGYFESDGNVYYNKNKKAIRIVLTSKCFHLLDEVRILLYKLNISCSIRKKSIRNSYYSDGIIYRLYIDKKEDVRQFKKHIKFISKYKQDALDSVDDIPSRSIYNNCYFEQNKENGKGDYYVRNNKLDNLGSVYVKSVEFIGDREIYNINAGISHTYISNGFISGNTGGDMEGGSQDFAEMFYNPKTYGFKAYDNIYDDNATGKCGWFIDHMWYYPGKYKDVVGKKEIDMVDEQGNSLRDLAEYVIDEKRVVKKKGTAASYQKYLTQEPKTPSEAFLRIEGSLFDAVNAQIRLGELQSNASTYIDSIHVVNLLQKEDGRIVHEYKDDLFPIREYPLKSADDTIGAIEIYEMPVFVDGIVPGGIYIACCDPYSDDKSLFSNSLGSCFVMNRITDRIVAEYTARPKTTYQYFENVRKLLLFYNASCNYENTRKGMFAYFERMNSLHLLCDMPQFLKDQQITRVEAIGNNAKGTPGSENVNSFARDLIINYCATQAYDKEPGVTNMYTIRSLGLLKEMISYNTKGNFDRVSAFGMLMILRESLCKRRASYEEIDDVHCDDFFKRNDPMSGHNIYSGSSFLD